MSYWDYSAEDGLYPGIGTKGYPPNGSKLILMNATIRCNGWGCGMPDNLVHENLELKKQLMEQWWTNHADHCGAQAIPWPHDGECKWPLPEAFSTASPSEIYLLLLLASGQFVGLRL